MDETKPISGRDPAGPMGLFARPADYDFFLSPVLIRRKERAIAAASDRQAAVWADGQRHFNKWALAKDTFTEEYVADGRHVMDRLFAELGPLTGNVLDVGGGWGLYRQWWDDNGGRGTFVVHDPGIERILAGPTEHHRAIYREAFARPVTFVNDFAENLDYRPASFDCVLFAESLDHVLDHQRALSRAAACLKDGGHLILVNHVESGEKTGAQARRYVKKLGEIKNPVTILKKGWQRLVVGDKHLRTFSSKSLAALGENLGLDHTAESYIEPTHQLAIKFSKAA
jgi:ubiquinone/menaquinone biosynthesis C-methylase UbiE